MLGLTWYLAPRTVACETRICAPAIAPTGSTAPLRRQASRGGAEDVELLLDTPRPRCVPLCRHSMTATVTATGVYFHEQGEREPLRK